MRQAIFVLLALTGVSLGHAQFFYHQPARLGLAFQSQHQHYHIGQPVIAAAAPQQYAHPSVIANSQREAELPPELSKSDRFYKNPHIAAALAKESWFTDKEMPVLDREAEKIPREMVYKIFKNAGWIKRR